MPRQVLNFVLCLNSRFVFDSVTQCLGFIELVAFQFLYRILSYDLKVILQLASFFAIYVKIEIPEQSEFTRAVCSMLSMQSFGLSSRLCGSITVQELNSMSPGSEMHSGTRSQSISKWRGELLSQLSGSLLVLLASRLQTRKQTLFKYPDRAVGWPLLIGSPQQPSPLEPISPIFSINPQFVCQFSLQLPTGGQAKNTKLLL